MLKQSPRDVYLNCSLSSRVKSLQKLLWYSGDDGSYCLFTKTDLKVTTEKSHVILGATIQFKLQIIYYKVI